jgi:hypothetical protein
MMTFEGFSAPVDFPPGKDSLRESSPGGFVYILFWIAGCGPVPLYVGQTGETLSKRLDWYQKGYLTTPTDFHVCEAIKHLKSKQYGVTLRFEPSLDEKSRKRKERTIIRELLCSGVWLLNCLPRYVCPKVGQVNEVELKAMEAAERDAVQTFCDMLTGKMARLALQSSS